MTRKAAEAEGKLPWFALVVADYLRDTQHLSLETQGAWMRILCCMHTSQTRGRVVFDKRKLARFLGTTDDRVVSIIAELRDEANPTGSPTCDFEEMDGGSFTMISRRMVRDEYIRQVNRKNGLKGGNKALVRTGLNENRLTDSVKRIGSGSDNPPVKAPLKGGVKAREQSQSQRKENTGEVSPDPSPDDAARSSAPAQENPVRTFASAVEQHAPDITVAPSKASTPPKRARVLSDEQNRVREAFTDWWTLEAWPKHEGRGQEYPFSAESARNGQAVMKLLTAVQWNLEEAKRVAMAYLLADDAFIAKQRRPLYGLTNQITTWISAARSPMPFRPTGDRYARPKPTAAQRGEYAEPERDLPTFGKPADTADGGDPSSVAANPVGVGDRAKAG